MIRHKFYIGMMAVALLLPSCSQEEDAALPQGADEVGQALTISTRATTDDSFDSFRLCLSDAATGTKKEEHILTKGANGAWLENGELPVTALLPAIVNASVCDNPDQITFENLVKNGELQVYWITSVIPTDQTDAGKLASACKLMYAFYPQLEKNGKLSLTFQHACSKLVFNVNKEKIEAAEGVGNLNSIKINANNESIYIYQYNNENRGWISGTPNDNGFDCFYNETDKTITAYIGYNKYKAGDVLMTLSVDGISRNVPINADLTVEPGNVYTFTLDITPKEVTANVVANEGNNDIPGWDESNEEEL